MKRQIAFAVVLSTIATGLAQAGIIGTPKVTYPTVQGSPAGYTVNDIRIDFTGQLFGQQMVVELTSGSIYQDGFGGETPPGAALIPVFPSLAADSFVTIGGFNSATTSSVLVIGGSTELGKNGPRKFDTQGVNIAWAPAPGVVINGGDDFPIARLTFSNDADGWIYLFSNAGGVGAVSQSTIRGGAIGFPDPNNPFPEPSAVVLVGIALFTGAIRRGRPNP